METFSYTRTMESEYGTATLTATYSSADARDRAKERDKELDEKMMRTDIEVVGPVIAEITKNS